jgi:hypothetical protein
MEIFMIGAVTIIVFVLLCAVLGVREHRNQKRPPIHTCQQNHDCRCQGHAIERRHSQCKKE